MCRWVKSMVVYSIEMPRHEFPINMSIALGNLRQIIKSRAIVAAVVSQVFKMEISINLTVKSEEEFIFNILIWSFFTFWLQITCCKLTGGLIYDIFHATFERGESFYTTRVLFFVFISALHQVDSWRWVILIYYSFFVNFQRIIWTYLLNVLDRGRDWSGIKERTNGLLKLNTDRIE